MRKIIFSGVCILIFIALSSFARAETTTIGTVYYRSGTTGAYFSSRVLGEINYCSYSLDGGQSWMTAFKDVFYGETYCKVQSTYFVDPGADKILMKVIDTLGQTRISIPPAIKVDGLMHIDPFTISPSFFDTASNKRYIPTVVNVSARVNNVIAGLSACRYADGDVTLSGEQVSRIDSTSYNCNYDQLNAGNLQLQLLNLKAIDTLGSNVIAGMSVEVDVTVPRSYVVSAGYSEKISVAVSAVDTQSGIKKVKLYKSFNGGSWAQVSEIATTTEQGVIGPREFIYTFNIDASNGNGSYDFFSVAEDMIGNIELMKSSSEETINVQVVTLMAPTDPPVTLSPTPSETLILTSIEPSVSVSVTQEEVDPKQEFLKEWIDYNIDNSLSIEILTDNAIYDENGVYNLRLFGMAPSNQEIKIRIFSDPYELTATADDNGSWTADVNEPLVAGEHDAYLYYMDPNQDYYRLEKELMLTVDLNNRQVFSNMNILPNSGAESATRGIISVVLMLFGTFMIVAAVAGFNHRKMKGNEAIEVLPRYNPQEGSSITIMDNSGRYV